MLKRFFTALGFLTIIPVGMHEETGEQDLRESIAAFAAVGLFQGLAHVAVDRAAWIFYPSGPVVGLVLLSGFVITGGFHLDALSDTFDGFSRRGSTEDKLGVMKDGASGVIGTAAVIFLLLIQYASLVALREQAYQKYLYTLIVMPVISKWTMVRLMHMGASARTEGLGAYFIGLTSRGAAVFNHLFAAACLISGGYFLLSGGAGNALAGYICVLVFGIAAWRVYKKVFGGLTGDMVGAAGELSAMIFLMVMAASC